MSLQNALDQVTRNNLALDKTKQFLSGDNRKQKFIEKIEADETKEAFLSIEGIDSEIYANLRTILNKYDLGGGKKIVAKQGRNGGLKIVDVEQPSEPAIKIDEEKSLEAASADANTQELRLEKEYYPLVEAWAKLEGFPTAVITGGMLPGFKWENPDLVSVSCSVTKYNKSIAFDVVSFEVKLRVDPYAVWQAVHYSRFSNRVYLAFAKSENEIREQDDGRVFELAVELGLGVLAYNASEKRFEEIQSPRSLTPDPGRIDETVDRFSRIDAIRAVIDKAIIEKAGIG